MAFQHEFSMTFTQFWIRLHHLMGLAHAHARMQREFSNFAKIESVWKSISWPHESEQFQELQITHRHSRNRPELKKKRNEKGRVVIGEFDIDTKMRNGCL
ncbi:unnamed protein product [Lathyrus oleraceus]